MCNLLGPSVAHGVQLCCFLRVVVVYWVGGVVELWNLLGRGLLDVSGCGYELVELVCCCGSRAW